MVKTAEDMQALYQHPNIVFRRQIYDCKENSPVSQYLATESHLLSLIADDQVTLPKQWLMTDLSAKGKELWTTILQRVNAHEYTDTLENAQLEVSRSGFWHDKRPNGAIQLNSWNNRILSGSRKSDGKNVCTSPLVFYDDEERWGYTKSGSLYKY